MANKDPPHAPLTRLTHVAFAFRVSFASRLTTSPGCTKCPQPLPPCGSVRTTGEHAHHRPPRGHILALSRAGTACTFRLAPPSTASSCPVVSGIPASATTTSATCSGPKVLPRAEMASAVASARS